MPRRGVSSRFVGARMPLHLYCVLYQYAKKRGLAVSTVIVDAVREYLLKHAGEELFEECERGRVTRSSVRV